MKAEKRKIDFDEIAFYCLIGIVTLNLAFNFINNSKEHTNIKEQQEQIEILERSNKYLKTENIKLSAENKAFKEVILNNYDYAELIYNIDGDLLRAIEKLETGNFTSKLYESHNNTYGANGVDGYYLYDNHAQSTLELARTLRYNYIDRGINKIEDIGKIFAPNDEEWADKVIELYNEIKK